MFRYFLKKISFGFFTLIGVVSLLFFLFQVLPGDPVSLMMGQRSDLETRKKIEKELGLDKPLAQRYLNYLNDISPISVYKPSLENKEKYNYTTLLPLGEIAVVIKKPYLGKSFQSARSVNAIIPEYAIGTLWLAVAAITFATFFGLLLGMISATFKDTFLDRSIVFFSTLGISLPSFVSGILISVVFGVILHEITGLNMIGSLYEISPEKGKHLALKNLILPAFTLGIRPLAIITQLCRSSVLEVLKEDYVRTARAKGLSEKAVILKHVLKNALNPVITSVSGWFASLLAGSFFVEWIFSWKGLGMMTITSVTKLDYPVVIGITLYIAFIFVFITLVVDIIYSILDPRVSFK